MGARSRSEPMAASQRGRAWRKSSRSGDTGCVEMAVVDDRVHVRDSKDLDGSMLILDVSTWRAFVAGIKAGDFNRVGQGP
jgi:Domain of unknown function (DUF397)